MAANSARPWSRFRPATFLAAALIVIGLSAFAFQHVWRENGLRALQAINEPRVELIANAVRAEINRQDHLPIVLSLDADVRNALAVPQDRGRLDDVSHKLERINAEADTRALYVIGKDGIVLAAASSDPTEVLVGRNLADRSYFVKAIESGRSSYLGVDPTNNRVRYYLTEAIRDAALLGVAVVRIEFDTLESAWGRGGEHVLITDADGVVFLASDAAYRYRVIHGASAAHLATESASPSYPDPPGKPVDLVVLERRGTNAVVQVKIGDDTATYLYQTLALPEFGWTIHRFADLDVVEADQRDGAIIGAAISALILSLLLYVAQRQRAYLAAKQAGARLRSEVADRTRELREANALLQTEVDERRRTEARLRATQNELVQAGKLAALGQMSAAIAHEVNQPLAALRTFMASTRIFAQRGDAKKIIKNLDLIDGLAERMASITNHLKTFARKSEPGRPEPVAVARAVEGALFLIESQIKAAGVRIDRDIQPDVWVSGYAVQLEQVLVNLIRNALDAASDVKRPAIEIAVRASDDTVRISIADNGPGVPPEVIDRIFDPFVTTKPVGKGLGLGLSITYGIVQDFRGRISASNRPQGGAEIVIELPRVSPETALLEKTAHA
jgi:two-component system, NtrC family, C4-dicarboxylate transport sensor histidine kinase DctB